MKHNVYKSDKIEYYTRAYKNHDRACQRRVIQWVAIINGKAVEGFSTKKAAIMAIQNTQ